MPSVGSSASRPFRKNDVFENVDENGSYRELTHDPLDVFGAEASQREMLCVILIEIRHHRMRNDNVNHLSEQAILQRLLCKLQEYALCSESIEISMLSVQLHATAQYLGLAYLSPFQERFTQFSGIRSGLTTDTIKFPRKYLFDHSEKMFYICYASVYDTLLTVFFYYLPGCPRHLVLALCNSLYDWYSGEEC